MDAVNEAKAEGAVVLRGGIRKVHGLRRSKNNTIYECRSQRNIWSGSFVCHGKDTAEAVSIVNASTFGLQASVFTRDEGTGLVVAGTLNTGTVQINGSPQRGPDHFPFLDKHSGVGVQGVRYRLKP